MSECKEGDFLKDIEKEKLLAVEGADEVNFFKVLLKHIGIEDVDIRDVAGKEQYKEKLPILIRTSGFEKVKILGITRDADRNAEGAYESLVNTLKDIGLSVPETVNFFTEGKPRVGIYILPGNNRNGELETLCLETVEDNPAMECVDKFIECAKKLKDKPKNIHKAQSQAFLAAMPKIANSIGLGAQKNYWDFDSDVLDELKKFLYNFK